LALNMQLGRLFLSVFLIDAELDTVRTRRGSDAKCGERGETDP